MGTLYLVATPIGNLEDISFRALRLLGQVGLIAAEDTRHTKKLLDHYQIRAELVSYHEHNKLSRVDRIIAGLAQGDVALVSDAGMPGLNDPGYELVKAVITAGYPVSPVPGPSAPLAALVSSGLPTDAFLYLGYLARKPAERRRQLAAVVEAPQTLIFLETPHRLLEALHDIEKVLGNRQVCVARELTKLHEEFIRGLVSQVRDHFTVQPPRGEFTLVIAGYTEEKSVWDENRLRQAIAARLEQGEPGKTIAARLAVESGWPRRDIYQIVLKINPG